MKQETERGSGGSLDLLVLAVLADEPSYGYQIQKRIYEASAGSQRLAAGTLYPLLHRLEAQGLLRSRWEAGPNRRRKWYRLTAAGRRALKQRSQRWLLHARMLRRLMKKQDLAGVEPG